MSRPQATARRLHGVSANGLRVLDLGALALSLLVVALLSLRAYGSVGGARDPVAVIEAPGARWVYPLNEDRRVVARGPLGEDLLIIRGGAIFAADCPCLNRICHLQGRISRPGQWIACLPNQLLIRIEGTDNDGIDGTAY